MITVETRAPLRGVDGHEHTTMRQIARMLHTAGAARGTRAGARHAVDPAAPGRARGQAASATRDGTPELRPAVDPGLRHGPHTSAHRARGIRRYPVLTTWGTAVLSVLLGPRRTGGPAGHHPWARCPLDPGLWRRTPDRSPAGSSHLSHPSRGVQR